MTILKKLKERVSLMPNKLALRSSKINFTFDEIDKYSNMLMQIAMNL